MGKGRGSRGSVQVAPADSWSLRGDIKPWWGENYVIDGGSKILDHIVKLILNKT